MTPLPDRERAARGGFQVEDVVAELFRRLGYKVDANLIIGGVKVHLVVEHDGIRSPVVASPLIRLRLRTLIEMAAQLHSLRYSGYDNPPVAVLAPPTD
jgi:hypothetical protein